MPTPLLGAGWQEQSQWEKGLLLAIHIGIEEASVGTGNCQSGQWWGGCPEDGVGEEFGFQQRLHQGTHVRAEVLKTRRVSPAN